MLEGRCINSPNKQRKKTWLAQHIFVRLLYVKFQWKSLRGGIFGFAQQREQFWCQGFNETLLLQHVEWEFYGAHTMLFIAPTILHHATSNYKATQITKGTTFFYYYFFFSVILCMELKMEINSDFLKLYCKKRMSHIFLVAAVSAFTKRKGGVRHGSLDFFCFC